MGKYTNQYRKSWELLDEFKGWIKRVKGRPDCAWCSFCSKVVDANKTALLNHKDSRDHLHFLYFGGGVNDEKLNHSIKMACPKRESEKIIKIEDINLAGEEKDFQTLQIELDISDSTNVIDVFKKPSEPKQKDKMKLRVAILTVSDRCFAGEAEDVSGTALRFLVDSCQLFLGEVVDQKCSPDDKECIQEVLMEWCDDQRVNLVLTTGGTGVAPRDVTPEAVKEIIEKEVGGMALRMTFESLKVTPLAMLSRPVCGVRGRTIIITLPGSAKASQECLRFVSAAIPHAVDLLTDQKSRIEGAHSALQERGVEVGADEEHSPTDEGIIIDEESVTSKATFLKLARRPRQSPFPLISVEQAQAKVLSKASQLSHQKMNTLDALGHALAEDVYAKEPLPPFPASIKDGYAVVAVDGAGSRRVVGQSCAGTEPRLREIAPGTCMRINTGAPIPPGADAVVQVEDTKLLLEDDEGAEEIEIQILKAPSEGQEIRPKGSDISIGELLLTQGQIIGPAEIGILASAGVHEFLVHRKPVVAVLSTGNELQDPSDVPLLEGHIYDSNKVALLSLLQQHSFPSYDAGIARDDPNDLLRSIRRALTHADILVTSGGVSMGDRDLLRPVLTSDLRAKIHFAQVFMKPGKPTTFATCTFKGKPKLILGLPGNPVSAIVTSHLYLLPLCRKMSGYTDYHSTLIRAKLASKIRLDPRPEYHRATLSWSLADNLPTAHSTGNQMSSRLMSMASAQALLQLPPASKDVTSLPAGSVVEAIVLSL